MKKLALLIALCLIATSKNALALETTLPSEEIPNKISEAEKTKIDNQKKKKLAEILKRVKKETDDFSGLVIYESWNSIENWKDDCYLVLKYSPEDNSCNMQWNIDYHADDWLFIESFAIKADNEKFFIVIPSDDNISREVRESGIWERIRLPYNGKEKEIKAISNAQNATIRFYGDKYYNDRKLSKAKIKALNDMSTLYNLCTEGYLNK